MKLDWDFHIPTAGMSALEKVVGLRSGMRKAVELGDCARLTKFYEDAGQLHWYHGRNVQTFDGYFVQAWDQEMCFVVEDDTLGICTVAPYLDVNIKCEVIKCRVPMLMVGKYMSAVHGALLFLSHFHPSQEVRVSALGELTALAYPELIDEARILAAGG